MMVYAIGNRWHSLPSALPLTWVLSLKARKPIEGSVSYWRGACDELATWDSRVSRTRRCTS